MLRGRLSHRRVREPRQMPAQRPIRTPRRVQNPHSANLRQVTNPLPTLLHSHNVARGEALVLASERLMSLHVPPLTHPRHKMRLRLRQLLRNQRRARIYDQPRDLQTNYHRSCLSVKPSSPKHPAGVLYLLEARRNLQNQVL